MATSIAGISFDLSFDGSKMLASINDSCKKVKDRFNQSFSQAAKKRSKLGTRKLIKFSAKRSVLLSLRLQLLHLFIKKKVSLPVRRFEKLGS